MRYLKLAELYEQLYKTGSTLAKTKLVADFLKKVSSNELGEVIILLQGRVFPEWDSRELGLGVRLAIKAISSASGTPAAKVEQLWKKIGDLGEVAEKVLQTKNQATLFSQRITTSKVISNLQKLASLEGAGTVDKKINLLKELLISAEPTSAKYIVRTCFEELRVGVGAGIIRDAISQAFNVDKKLVQHGYDLSTDFGSVAKIAKEKGDNGLEKLQITVGKPIKVMLYQRVENTEEAFKVVGKPAQCEFKYDGFRLNIHRKGKDITLYTRRLEDVTKQFPDVVKVAKEAIKSTDYVVDCEVIGFDPKTKKWLPFQNISERIKRKYNIEEMVRKIPVITNVFDIVYLNGKTLISEPFEKRRKAIEKIVKTIPNKINPAVGIITFDLKTAEDFMKHSLALGNEGIMMKNLTAKYKPGSRVGYGVKVKPAAESLDLVIVGAEWGHGKRGGWLSSFVLACRDPRTGEFLEIGKMGTGIKEKKEAGVSFGELTKLLKPLIIEEKGGKVKVKPKVVVEVAYEEIQASPSYKSGYALRFPRMVRLRDDRMPEEADTPKRVEELYEAQRGRR